MFNRFIQVLALSAMAAAASAYLPGPLLLALGDNPNAPIVGQIFVKVTPGKEASVAKAYATKGYTLIRAIPHIGWQLLKTPTSTSLTAAATSLKSISGVAKTYPNYPVYAHATVNDPLFSRQYAYQKMQVPAAWDINMGSASTIVAVLDTGTDYTHPDLKNKVIKGKDTYDNDMDPMDESGHGTHVSGSVGAETNNGIGVSGGGYNTKVLAVRVLGPGGGSTVNVADGIVWAADNGANIINMSLGGAGDGSGTNPVGDDAIAYAYNTKNVLILASAGNSGSAGNPRSWPAYNSLVVAVGASDQNDKQSDFTEFNPIDGSDNWVDIAAPGVEVLSTVMGGGYESAGWSGTSMACPNASGVASLSWTALSDAGQTVKNSDVRKLLEDNCDPIGKWVNKGRVNAFNALGAIGVPVTVDAFATTPEAMDGATFPQGNDPQTLQVVDNISLKMLGHKKSGVGLTGSFATNFPVSTLSSSELRSATLNFRVSGDKKATIQLFMYDELNGKWVLYSAKPATVAPTNLSFNLNKATIAKYTGSEGIRLMVRSLVPTSLSSGALGVTTVDRLTVTYKGVRRFGSTNP